MKFKQIIIGTASLALASLANAQVLTGTLNATGESPNTGSYTSTSLALSGTNLITSVTGFSGSTIGGFTQLMADYSTINGLSSTPTSESINDFFEISSGTSPADRFDFNLSSLSESTMGVFSGAGTLVDTTDNAQGNATFSLSFSGPNTYSFSLMSTAVPEPTTVSLVGVGLLGAWAFRRRKV